MRNKCSIYLRFLKLVDRFCEVDFDYNPKVDDESVFLILKVNQEFEMTYSRMTLSKRTRV